MEVNWKDKVYNESSGENLVDVNLSAKQVHVAFRNTSNAKK